MWLGGQLLQLRVGTSKSRSRAHSGDSSGAYGSSLDDGGVVGLSSTARRVTQVARAQAAMAIGDRVCSLTTVQCGATDNGSIEAKEVFRTSPLLLVVRIVLTLVTLGLWIIVWLLIAINGRLQLQKVHVDLISSETGTVEVRLKALTRGCRPHRSTSGVPSMFAPVKPGEGLL